MAALTALRPFLFGLGLLAAGAVLTPVPANAAAVQLEYAVKASYLSKFAPFVLWPDDVLAPGAPFTICLAGEHRLDRAIDDAARGQVIGGRPLVIRRLGSSGSPGACQILFIGRTAQAEALMRAATAYPILTVTDRDRGPGGGMIEFTLRSGRVRFVIDSGAARASGLQISSKLLSLAMSVKGR